MNEAIELSKLLEIEPRVCGLPTCGVTFKPRLDWQKYCCTAHSKRARAIRRRERVKVALSLLDDNKGKDKL